MNSLFQQSEKRIPVTEYQKAVADTEAKLRAILQDTTLYRFKFALANIFFDKANACNGIGNADRYMELAYYIEKMDTESL